MRRIREACGNFSAPPEAGLAAGLSVPDSSLVADSQFMAAARASAAEHGAPVLGLHALTEPVYFRAFTIVRLKCAFRHLYSFLDARDAASEGARARNLK